MSKDQKPAITVKNLTKSFKIPVDKGQGVKSKILGRSKKGYREFTPLNNISFTIYEGDFFGVVGRNGSGKSTLLKTIAGIYEPTEGKVEVNGTLVPFIELGVGFNPQLTGRDNVYLNAAMLGFDRKEIDEMYDDIVDFAELHDFMEERLQNYSSGMQVRLAFSIAIRAKGDILLLDEVLAVGDSAFQQKCFDYFEQLKREKKTVILVTHSMSNVERFCTRGLLLDSGEVDTIGSSEEVASRYKDLFRGSAKKISIDNSPRENKIEILSANVTQFGKETETIKQKKEFIITLKMKLLDHRYTAHNISAHIRNRQDISVAFMSTIGEMPNCFDTASDEFQVEFIVNSNIYNAGEYYIDLSARSGVQSEKAREVTLDQKHAIKFNIEGTGEGVVGSVTLPSVSVTSKGVVYRESLWD